MTRPGMTPLQRLKKYQGELRVIGKVKSDMLKQALIKEFSKDRDFCLCVRQLAKNAVKKNIPIRPTDRKKLNKHHKIIRGVLHKNRSISRRFVKQSGGFLPLLAGIALPLLVDLIVDHVIPKNDGNRLQE